MISLDPTLLFLSLITSGAGFVLFIYGKKQERWPQLVAGLALMIYPYFVPNAAVMVAIAVGLIALLWIVLKRDL